MALKKSKNLHNSIVAEYWKITNLSVDRKSGRMEAQLSLFISKAASDAGEPPFMSHRADGKFTKEQLSGDLSALAYQMFKNIAATPIVVSLVPDRQRNIKTDLNGAEDV